MKDVGFAKKKTYPDFTLDILLVKNDVFLLARKKTLSVVVFTLLLCTNYKCLTENHDAISSAKKELHPSLQPMWDHKTALRNLRFISNIYNSDFAFLLSSLSCTFRLSPKPIAFCT
jgi:hypothetical protein